MVKSMKPLEQDLYIAHDEEFIETIKEDLKRNVMAAAAGLMEDGYIYAMKLTVTEKDEALRTRLHAHLDWVKGDGDLST